MFLIEHVRCPLPSRESVMVSLSHKHRRERWVGYVSLWKVTRISLRASASIWRDHMDGTKT